MMAAAKVRVALVVAVRARPCCSIRVIPAPCTVMALNLVRNLRCLTLSLCNADKGGNSVLLEIIIWLVLKRNTQHNRKHTRHAHKARAQNTHTQKTKHTNAKQKFTQKNARKHTPINTVKEWDETGSYQ